MSNWDPKISHDLGMAISTRDISKAFGRTTVLRDVNLDVPWGQFLVIFGPNGSGKTTLIKVMATLLRPTKGEVSVGGIDYRRNAAAIRRLIGVVTHQPLLYEELTAYENLQFFGRMYLLENLMDRIEEVASLVGVEDRLHHRVGTLSHGLQRRVSLGRALLHDPPILLMDEPETGLDQSSLDMLDDILRAPPKGGSRTIVMTTHNLAWGLGLADSVAILSRGGITFRESRAQVADSSFRGLYLKHTEEIS